MELTYLNILSTALVTLCLTLLMVVAGVLWSRRSTTSAVPSPMFKQRWDVIVPAGQCVQVACFADNPFMCMTAVKDEVEPNGYRPIIALRSYMQAFCTGPDGYKKRWHVIVELHGGAHGHSFMLIFDEVLIRPPNTVNELQAHIVVTEELIGSLTC